MWPNPILPWIRKEGEATPSKLSNSLLFLDLFLYLSFFSAIGKEAGRRWEIVREDVSCEGVTTSFIALWCSNLGGKVVGLHRHRKKAL
jgi:hypothetical protein